MPLRTMFSSRSLRRTAAGVVIGAAAAATIATAAPAQAAAPAFHHPYGGSHVTLFGQRAHVWGAAADPDTRRPVLIRIAVSGWPYRYVWTNPRTHAYAYWITLPYGYHTISASAFNQGPGYNVLLGTNRVAVRNYAAHNPHGTSWFHRYGQVVKFDGRTADPDARGQALLVRLWHNGHIVYTTRSGPLSRYYAVWCRLSSGYNSFSVVAVNKGLGTHNTVLRHLEFATTPSWISQYTGNRRIAAEMLPSYGWGADQMRALDRMWYVESNWLTYAANPSGAYGIPQALPGSKMASAGADWRTNPATQIRWGLNYIRMRYGTPAHAWAVHQTLGWY